MMDDAKLQRLDDMAVRKASFNPQTVRDLIADLRAERERCTELWQAVDGWAYSERSNPHRPDLRELRRILDGFKPGSEALRASVDETVALRERWRKLREWVDGFWSEAVGRPWMAVDSVQRHMDELEAGK